MSLGTHAIKVRFEGEKVWYFLTPDGGQNRLRIHAATLSEADAKLAAAEVSKNHKNVQAKAVKL